MTTQVLNDEFVRTFLKNFTEAVDIFPEGFSLVEKDGVDELSIYARNGIEYAFVFIHQSSIERALASKNEFQYKDYLLLDMFNSIMPMKYLRHKYRDFTWIMFWGEYLYWMYHNKLDNPYSRNPYDYIWLLEQDMTMDEKFSLLSCGAYKEADALVFKEIPMVYWTRLTDKTDMLESMNFKEPIHLYM